MGTDLVFLGGLALAGWINQRDLHNSRGHR